MHLYCRASDKALIAACAIARYRLIATLKCRSGSRSPSICDEVLLRLENRARHGVDELVADVIADGNDLFRI
jgi:hypothetical protein